MRCHQLAVEVERDKKRGISSTREEERGDQRSTHSSQFVSPFVDHDEDMLVFISEKGSEGS